MNVDKGLVILMLDDQQTERQCRTAPSQELCAVVGGSDISHPAPDDPSLHQGVTPSPGSLIPLELYWAAKYLGSKIAGAL